MTAIAVAGRAPTVPATGSGGGLAGTGALVRLGLRRERIPLAAWMYGLSVTVLSSFLLLPALYPDAAARESVRAIASNPAFLVITGPLNSTSIAGLTAWRYGVLAATMVGLMAMFTVVRRTRADEELGRTELLASGVLGRLAPLTAGSLLAGGASLTIGAIIAVGGMAMGQPVTGSLAFGVALAGPGLVFAGIAAIAAQLVESARTANALTGACLGIAFALRAIADVSPDRLGWLAWLSPFGWTSKVSPYGGDRWAVAGLFVAATAVALAIAFRLQGRRDLGLGVFPARLGPATNPRLGTPLALAGRLHRGSLIGWTVALIAYGAVSGTIAPTAGDLLKGSSPQLLQLMHELGGPGAISQTLLVVMAGLAGLIAAVYAVTATLRMSAEETALRAEPILATAVDRRRWMGGHLLYALGGPAAVLAIGGVAAGLVNGAGSAQFGPGFRDGLDSMLVQIPAVLVMGGLAAALFGVLPRLTSLAWVAVAVALLLGQLGPILKLPRAVMDISPFSHVPGVPAAAMSWTPMLTLTLIAAVLIALGLVGFRRRNMRSAG